MDLLWSIGLIVVILLALNHMAGGRPGNVLGPVGRIAGGIVSFAVRLVTGLFGSVLKIGVGSAKLPKHRLDKDDGGPGPPPPRWK